MRSKIAVSDLDFGIARHATAGCALRADDLRAFMCDQHVTGSLLQAFGAHYETEWQRSGPTIRRGDLSNYVWLATGAGTPEANRQRAILPAGIRRWQAAADVPPGRLGR